MTKVRHDIVTADAVTGEWLGEPVESGVVDLDDHLSRMDTDDAHYDTYQAPVIDDTGCDTGDMETRAVTVRWLREEK